MTIEQELLLRAWPDGYLAMRGVQTAGGRWQCTKVQDSFVLFSDPDEYDGDVVIRQDQAQFRGIAVFPSQDGSLLPNVDPADVATWACLLADLWFAKWGEPAGTNLFWRHEGPEDYWILGQLEAAQPKERRLAPSSFRGTVSFNVDPEEARTFTQDPARALVLARIQLREEKGR